MSKENNKDDMDLSIAAELKKRGDMPMPMFRDFVGYVSDIDPHGDQSTWCAMTGTVLCVWTLAMSSFNS